MGESQNSVKKLTPVQILLFEPKLPFCLAYMTIINTGILRNLPDIALSYSEFAYLKKAAILLVFHIKNRGIFKLYLTKNNNFSCIFLSLIC